MPLNMNTVGTGSIIYNGNTSNTIIGTDYSENLKSAVSDIGECNITTDSIGKASFPLNAEINSPYTTDGTAFFGTVHLDNFYYGCALSSNTRTSNYLYKYSITRKSDGTCTRTVTAITSLKSVTSVCRFGDKLLCIGGSTYNSRGITDCFYLFDGTSFTKINSTSVLSMVGLSNPSNNNADGVYWCLYPSLNEDLSLSDMIYAHTCFPGSSTDNTYSIRAYFKYNKTTGKITCAKSQYYNNYSSTSVIEAQMDHLYDTAHGVTDETSFVTIPIAVDRFIKVLVNTGKKTLTIRLFKWDWYVTTGMHNGSNDTLTIIQEESINIPKLITSRYSLSVEPLSHPEYDSYSIMLSYYDEISSYNSPAGVSEILFLNILASFKFKISRATLGFSNTQITSLTNYQRIIRHHFNLYENKPWLMLLHSRGGYGTMVIIDIGLTGEVNTSGTRYTITGQFVSGDTIYSDDGIISMTHGGTTTTSFNDIHKVRIPDNGEYTFMTYSSTAYMRPSFVVQTKSGSILHLDIRQLNDTDISGYFTIGMTINDVKITKTGFQTLQNIITNNRLIISL